LIVSGAFRIISALVVRFQDWGWALLNGGVTLLALGGGLCNLGYLRAQQKGPRLALRDLGPR
jgi:hypothetical protein